MVSLIQLEYIVALDTYGSFSIAAEKCFVTQPTLSMQIKKMESDLGITIFDRNQHPIQVTEIGKIIIAQARIILAESNKIQEIIQVSKNALNGELRIGIIPSLAPFLLPRFIGTFAKNHDGIKTIIVELTTAEMVDQLIHEKIDIGILVSPLEEKQLKEEPIIYEKILLYANANHEYAKLENIKLNQINTENLWLLTQGHCFRNQMINLCRLKDKQRSLSFEYESASIETLMKFVDKEGGFTLIPELAAQDLSIEKQKNAKEIKDVKPVREISLVTNKVFIKHRMYNALKETILDSLPKEMQAKNRGSIVEWK